MTLYFRNGKFSLQTATSFHAIFPLLQVVKTCALGRLCLYSIHIPVLLAVGCDELFTCIAALRLFFGSETVAALY